MSDMKHCMGCENNFYNGNNPYGVKECWSLKTAKMISKMRIPVQMPPPYKFKAVKVYDCRHEKGYVLVKPENLTKEGYWK